jgi:catechol 2,3-dioxygenase
MTDSPRATAATGGADAAYGIAPDGFRLPAETALGPVRLQVTDLERSLDYYGRVLGFDVSHRAGGAAMLAARGDGRPLIELRERPGAAPVPMHGRLGLYHFAILLPTRADLGRFLRHLAEVGERAGASDHFVSEALYLRDPDGLGIEVYADRPRSDWETIGRELRMETAPLNAPEILREAGGGSWTGMPAGTTIGHVHLHVGDLQAAAAFYHQALGLDKVVWSYPGALFLSAGGYHHHLGLNTWAAGAAPAGDADAKLLEWTVELPDADGVAAAGESLAAAGYAAERSSDGSIVTRDPWGTQLRLRARAAAGGRGE